jgi:hypothetical protein
VRALPSLDEARETRPCGFAPTQRSRAGLWRELQLPRERKFIMDTSIKSSGGTGPIWTQTVAEWEQETPYLNNIKQVALAVTELNRLNRQAMDESQNNGPVNAE